MGSPLISVVVPVHNVESTVTRCVRSLLAQTYKFLEIILVENGSSDDSLRVCSELERLSSKITLVSSGVSDVMHARNLGVEISSGDYVAFCDSDDWYLPFAIEKLVEKALRYRAQIVKAGYDKVIAPGIPVKMHRSYASNDTTLRRNEWGYEDYARFYNPLRYPFSSGLCSSLYERDLILATPSTVRENGLRRGEDILLNAFLYESAETIVTIPDILYCYRLGGVTSGNERLVNDLLLFRSKLDAFFLDIAPFPHEELGSEFDCYFLSILLKRYQNCSALGKRDLIDFYQSLADDDRIVDIAQRVLSRSRRDEEVELIARLLADGDARGMFDLAKSRYWKQRLVLKVGNRASRLLSS